MADRPLVRDQQHLYVGMTSNAYSGLGPAGMPRLQQEFQSIHMTPNWINLMRTWIGPREYAWKCGPLIGSTCLLSLLTQGSFETVSISQAEPTTVLLSLALEFTKCVLKKQTMIPALVMSNVTRLPNSQVQYKLLKFYFLISGINLPSSFYSLLLPFSPRQGLTMYFWRPYVDKASFKHTKIHLPLSLKWQDKGMWHQPGHCLLPSSQLRQAEDPSSVNRGRG